MKKQTQQSFNMEKFNVIGKLYKNARLNFSVNCNFRAIKITTISNVGDLWVRLILLLMIHYDCYDMLDMYFVWGRQEMHIKRWESSWKVVTFRARYTLENSVKD
jgi:hypothetical protein